MCLCMQLTECCVDVLVTAFKESILAECASMITNNETERKCIDIIWHILCYVFIVTEMADM